MAVWIRAMMAQLLAEAKFRAAHAKSSRAAQIRFSDATANAGGTNVPVFVLVATVVLRRFRRVAKSEKNLCNMRLSLVPAEGIEPPTFGLQSS
jgi:hypothetical protein